jgi:starch synthase
MSNPLRILFLSAEVAPFAKRGGLGDVGGSLPKALHALGHDVRVVMPAYANIEAGYAGVEAMPGHMHVPMRGTVMINGVFRGRLPNSDVPIYFIAERNLLGRPEVYGYQDDAYRFAFYCRAALELMAILNWRPHLVHANDWHTAPAVTWLATAARADHRLRNIPTVFSIHNLAHQGLTSWDIFDYLQLQTHRLQEEGHNQVNFMARGIHHATLINTVSPTYAREIMTPAGGAHLDGMLRYRAPDVSGILNGIDTDEWNPATDKRLPHHYDASHLDGKQKVKQALQAALGLPERSDVPLVAMVTRLDYQKGLDITGDVLHRLLNAQAGEAQFVVLGTGADEYENMLAHLAGYHRSKMRAVLAYNASLAPLIYGGSDMFIMPSRFEPCGLGQLIAMRYGTIPIAKATGGLVDTIWDGQTGFLFSEHTAEAFWEGLRRAMWVYYHNKAHWQHMQVTAMSQDFSWERSARGYEQLYERAIARSGL